MWRRVVTGALVAALFIPVFRTGDGVPLSSYPMYAEPRSAHVEFVVAYGVSADGDRVDLSMSTVAATSDPLIAEAYLRDGVARADRTCADIAARAGGEADLVAIALVSESHDVVARVRGERSLESTELHARCELP